MLANIVERTVKGLPPEAYACWAPGSNNSGTVEAFNAAISGGLALQEGDFQLGARWSSTATDGSGLGQGDPMTLRYSCIESTPPLASHLAEITVVAEGDAECTMIWKTSVEPVAFEPFILQAMQASFDQLEKLLS